MSIRNAGVTLLSLSLLVTAVAAGAAEQRLARVGLLRSGQPPDPFADAFIDEMRTLGYVEGETVSYEIRWAAGRPDRLGDLARELAAHRVQVIVTGGDSAVRSATQAAPGIPVIMGASNDPVGSGIAASLSHPGGKVTGLTIFSQELSQKRLELFREAVPRLTSVAVLYNPAFPSARTDLEQTQAAGRALGISLVPIPVHDPSEFEPVFTQLGRDGIDGLITLADPFFTAHRERLAQLARAANLPTMFHWPEFVQAGGLISYGPDNSALYRRAAHYTAKILKGAKPEELPIEQPTHFLLGVNLRTAQMLGISIPVSVLARANEVVE